MKNYIKKLAGMAMAILLLIPAISNAQGKDQIYKGLVKKYGEISSVSFDFSMDGHKDVKGYIKAVKGNKYVLKSGTRSIYCDSKTIWNYDERSGKVMISNFEEAEEGEVALESFFFRFIKNYKVKKISKVNASGNKKAYELEMEASGDSVIMDYSSVIIRVDRKTLDILSVQVNDGENIQNWNIDKLKTNIKIDNKEFVYTPPENVVVIDMR